jgi:hypothetical protein
MEVGQAVYRLAKTATVTARLKEKYRGDANIFDKLSQDEENIEGDQRVRRERAAHTMSAHNCPCKGVATCGSKIPH